MTQHIKDIIDWLPLITLIIVTVFDWGIIYSKIKRFLTKEDVVKIIGEEFGKITYSKEQISTVVDNKLVGHYLPVQIVESKVQALERWKEQYVESANAISNDNQMMLQELRLNMKRLCEKSGIEYLNGNSK